MKTIRITLEFDFDYLFTPYWYCRAAFVGRKFICQLKRFKKYLINDSEEFTGEVIPELNIINIG